MLMSESEVNEWVEGREKEGRETERDREKKKSRLGWLV